MASTQELTRRIKSVKSTRKVTRAMQMVSASKMRKAQAATLASRGYSDYAAELVHSLGVMTAPEQGVVTPDVAKALTFLEPHEKARTVGIVVISSNRGMVGSFNANLFSKGRELEKQYADCTFEYIVFGRKAGDLAVRLRRSVVADFPKDDALASIDEVVPLVAFITEQFSRGYYRAVHVIYNKFISTITQSPTALELLPFVFPAQRADTAPRKTDYLYEPNPVQVLKNLLPRVLESQIFQAVLESDASEHSARMVMMKNATDNAGDLIADLTLTFNQLRQNKITTELSEITAGKIALEQ